jgi:hypothetical protein
MSDFSHGDVVFQATIAFDNGAEPYGSSDDGFTEQHDKFDSVARAQNWAVARLLERPDPVAGRDGNQARWWASVERGRMLDSGDLAEYGLQDLCFQPDEFGALQPLHFYRLPGGLVNDGT